MKILLIVGGLMCLPLLTEVHAHNIATTKYAENMPNSSLQACNSYCECGCDGGGYACPDWADRMCDDGGPDTCGSWCYSNGGQ